MRAIAYSGAIFFQPCFVSFADEQSAIQFVLEDLLITTLLCVVHWKICRWADVHIVHIVECIFLSTARDCTSLCVHVHMSSITQISSRYSCKSTTLVPSANVLSSTSLVNLQKSCHPPPWWSSPSVCAYQSVLVIYSLHIFSICVFLHMFCICLRLVSMFVLQVTLVCHCVTWETRWKLHWLQVCCPASLLQSTHNQGGPRSEVHSLNLWTTGHVSMGPLLPAGGSTIHPLWQGIH